MNHAPSRKTTQEHEPETPARFHPNSRANQIAVLDNGETYSMSIRLEFDKSSKADIDGAVATLKSALSKAADTAKARSGNKYITEVGYFFTRSNDIIVTAAVTRTE